MLSYFLPVDRFSRALWLAALLTMTASASVPESGFVDVPSDGQMTSADGVVTLTWKELPAPWEIELQQSDSPDFATVVERYVGRDTGSVLTGLPEGTHHYRVRAVHPEGAAGSWSDPLHVEVTFMDRGRLFLLLGLGGIVVLATAGAIIGGYLNHRGEIKAEGAA